VKANEITAQIIDSYRQNGFVRIPNVITREEAEFYYGVSERIITEFQEQRNTVEAPFVDFDALVQIVNVWQIDEDIRKLTFHPNVARAAEILSGRPLRLWHDHFLAKMPHNDAATEFHQDQPYWPHAGSLDPISAWIALCDVPVERGPMTFIPESHQKTGLPVQSLNDPRSLFTICPELEYWPRVTLPLKAGDCTFHHGRTAHMATPNRTDVSRLAHVVIYMDRDTCYRELAHVVTDPLELKAGDRLDGPLFPEIPNE